jgi:hypothetical protein
MTAATACRTCGAEPREVAPRYRDRGNRPRLSWQIDSPVQSDKEVGELNRSDVKKSFCP